MAHNLTEEHIKMAQQSEERYGVPASVTLGQFILESGAGTSDLYKRSNNAFGITGSYHGDYVMMGGRSWRAYSSLAESFDDHGELLAKPLYAEKTAGAGTVSEYIDAFAETYAPASDGNNNYAGTLKQIIVENDLTQYDITWAGKSGLLDGGTSSTASGDFWGAGVLGIIIKIGVYILLFTLAVISFVRAFDDSAKLPKVKLPKKPKTEGEGTPE